MFSSAYCQLRQCWRDAVIVIILAAIAGCASYRGSQLIDMALFDGRVGYDVWFESDLPRVVENMTGRPSNKSRTEVHPLFILMTFPAVHVLRAEFGLGQVAAVQVAIATVAVLWIGTIFILLRLIGCRRPDATLFSLLAMISAAAVIWFTVPETYPFGSLSILLALCLVVVAQDRVVSPLWYVAISAATLSFTLTNWMAGILVTLINHSWKQSLRITVAAFCLVVALGGGQRWFFPNARLFSFPVAGGEAQYMLSAESGGLLHVVNSFVFHTMIMPGIHMVVDDKPPHKLKLSIQSSLPGSGGAWGAVAIVLWAALLGLGLWGLFSAKRQFPFRLVLGLTLCGQFLLHVLYGNETFLYSLHWAPLLVVLGALSTLTPARKLGLIMASLLVFSMGVNNWLQFSKARMLFGDYGLPRYEVRTQMRLRPSDPWPRGVGHVVLAEPGSQETDKAYHEPGGSFSPTVGSFGVSLWVTDANGNLEATSDSIPLENIHQQFTWANTQNLPGILTETGFYQALWSMTQQGRWTLHLTAPADSSAKLTMVVRSVGPAGGPISSLDWNGQRLIINDRWSMSIYPPPAEAHLGEEGPQGWMTEPASLAPWRDKRGWGYARFKLGNGGGWTVIINDFLHASGVELKTTETRPVIKLDLPEERFVASLDAQLAHMLMSLVGQQTRPGEPINYPLSWLRDGAYVVVALARAGHLEAAKELSTYFAENDFFGGFGSEADAPGLAIWALEEVAVRLHQQEYDRWLWPHVRRKAELIVKMLATDQPIYQPVAGPIVPKLRDDPGRTLVAWPARDGLIVGRMDHHRPLLFVNAVSYRGLLDAVSLANRVGQVATAERWRVAAATLQQAWRRAFKPPQSENDRTYINGLWPTWIAASDSDSFLQGLQSRWTLKHDERGGFRTIPLWTYFEIAEAHQWLLLHQQDQVWATLRWFWDHQASPGLYTWWEGMGEENTFHRWELVRGWVNPPHVTPHYWTAAEMALLQLDMLAYADEAAIEPTVVIGAGVPSQWLVKPMSVQGLLTRIGQVDWTWKNKEMRVVLHSSRCKVRLGPAFPPSTPLHVAYLNPQ